MTIGSVRKRTLKGNSSFVMDHETWRVMPELPGNHQAVYVLWRRDYAALMVYADSACAFYLGIARKETLWPATSELAPSTAE